MECDKRPGLWEGGWFQNVWETKNKNHLALLLLKTSLRFSELPGWSAHIQFLAIPDKAGLEGVFNAPHWQLTSMQSQHISTKIDMPWPSCKASSPSTILHGRSPKTVTQIGFATPWILILVDPLTSKDVLETPRKAGASASSLWRWARSTILWKMSSRRSVQEAPVSTNALMDRPPTCKSITGRPEITPTTFVCFPQGFGVTRGACGQRSHTRSSENFRQGSNQPWAPAQYPGVVLVLFLGMLAKSQER